MFKPGKCWEEVEYGPTFGSRRRSVRTAFPTHLLSETAREGPKLEGWEMVALGGVMGNLDQRQDCLLALRRGDFG